MALKWECEEDYVSGLIMSALVQDCPLQKTW